MWKGVFVCLFLFVDMDIDNMLNKLLSLNTVELRECTVISPLSAGNAMSGDGSFLAILHTASSCPPCVGGDKLPCPKWPCCP